MFVEEYRKAYDEIRPRPDSMARILDAAREQKKPGRGFSRLVPIMGGLLLFLSCSLLSMPVMAQNIPQVYHVLEKYAPELLNSILPEETSDSNAGIIMQVEAVSVEGNEAEVVVSFRDEEGFDYINGPVDLYDSYALECFGATSNVAGCSFLEYDPVADKAYFNIQVSSFDTYRTSLMTFRVNQLLTRFQDVRRPIEMDKMIESPRWKSVGLNGLGGALETRQLVEKYLKEDRDSSHPYSAQVLDMGELGPEYLEDLAVTGMAYENGLLRVQVCRGNFTDADRHAEIFLTDARGNDRIHDMGIHWQQEIAGERVLMEEHWFLVDEDWQEQYTLNGVFHYRDNSVKGKWKVMFKL